MSELPNGLIDELAARPVVTEAPVFDIRARAELAVTALKSLGLVKDPGEATDYFEASAETLKDSLADEQGNLAIVVETFPAIPLTERLPLLGEGGLRERYDGRKGTPKTYVDQELWSQYSLAELNRRDFVAAGQPESPVLPVHMRGMLLDGDHPYEASLYFAGQDAQEQEASFGSLQSDWRTVHPGSDILAQNIADIVIVDAQRREEQPGVRLLDEQTFRRVLQLGFKAAGGGSVVGYVDSRDGRLWLGGSNGDSGGVGGLGLSVGPKLEASNS